MRIAINCRSILLSSRTGIGRYTYHLIDALGKIDPNDKFLLYAPQRMMDTKRQLPSFPYPNFSSQVDFFRQGPKPSDIFHLPCPDRIGQFKGKVVVTIHDLIHKTYPQAHTKETIELTEGHLNWIAKRADWIICISENTRKDFHRFYNFPQERTCAILNGVEHEIFYPLKDTAAAGDFLKGLGVEPGFILCVGTIEPRKNVQGVLEAMAQMKNAPKLVVVGMKGWMTEQIMPRIGELGLTDKVVFTGFVEDAQLNMLYNTCGVFVFPSFYEGFGFPIVEAFCAGVPVVVSNASCGPEIAGDAALLVDPASPQQIAQAIDRILGDGQLRAGLKNKALARAAQFSFEKTARETLEVYRHVFPE